MWQSMHDTRLATQGVVQPAPNWNHQPFQQAKQAQLRAGSAAQAGRVGYVAPVATVEYYNEPVKTRQVDYPSLAQSSQGLQSFQNEDEEEANSDMEYDDSEATVSNSEAEEVSDFAPTRTRLQIMEPNDVDSGSMQLARRRKRAPSTQFQGEQQTGDVVMSAAGGSAGYSTKAWRNLTKMVDQLDKQSEDLFTGAARDQGIMQEEIASIRQTKAKLRRAAGAAVQQIKTEQARVQMAYAKAEQAINTHAGLTTLTNGAVGVVYKARDINEDLERQLKAALQEIQRLQGAVAEQKSLIKPDSSGTLETRLTTVSQQVVHFTQLVPQLQAEVASLTADKSSLSSEVVALRNAAQQWMQEQYAVIFKEADAWAVREAEKYKEAFQYYVNGLTSNHPSAQIKADAEKWLAERTSTLHSQAAQWQAEETAKAEKWLTDTLAAQSQQASQNLVDLKAHADAAVDELRQQLDTARTELTAMTQERDLAKQDKDAMNGEFQLMKTEADIRDNLRDELSRAVVRISELTDQCTAGKSQIASLRAQLAQLSSITQQPVASDPVQGDLNKKKQLIQEQQSKIQDLKRQLVQANSMCRKAQADLLQLQAQTRAASESQLPKDSGRGQTDREGQAQIKALRKELEAVKAELDEQVAHARNLHGTSMETHQDAALRSELLHTEMECGKLREERDMLREALKRRRDVAYDQPNNTTSAATSAPAGDPTTHMMLLQQNMYNLNSQLEARLQQGLHDITLQAQQQQSAPNFYDVMRQVNGHQERVVNQNQVQMETLMDQVAQLRNWLGTHSMPYNGAAAQAAPAAPPNRSGAAASEQSMFRVAMMTP